MNRKLCFIFVLFFSVGLLYAQESPAPTPATPPVSQDAKQKQPEMKTIKVSDDPSVMLDGHVLFQIHSPLGPFSPSERAVSIGERLSKLNESQTFKKDKLRIVASEFTTDIVYENLTIMSITPDDALREHKSSDELAKEYAAKIVATMKSAPLPIAESPNELYMLVVKHKGVLIRASLVFAALIVYLMLHILLSKIFSKLYLYVDNKREKSIKSISMQGHVVINDHHLVKALIYVLKSIRFAIGVGLLYLLMLSIFIFFPWAKSEAVMEIVKGVILTIITLTVIVGLYKLINISMNAVANNLVNWKGTLINSLQFKSIHILSEDKIIEILKRVIIAIKVVLNLFMLYILLPVVFSFFEFTGTWASTLFDYILTPLKVVFSAFLNFLPNLFFIAVIIAVIRYAIKLADLFFEAVGDGSITLPNFHRDWAETTYKIVRSLIIVFALIIIFPYLPGSQSEAFKGVSIFLGLLFSLGSTSIIANVVAGTILTYMYAFKIGDKVKIENTMGKVIEKTLLVTRIKTITNIVITIPNSTVMGSHIVNYTTSASAGDGLFLTTTIKLGYETPWRKVHETLVAAALLTANVKRDPHPFVYQLALDDFSVAYELNCVTDRPDLMADIYSELHQNVQDKCNEAGIEIMTPHYMTLRDGNRTTIPDSYLPATYTPPAFALKVVNKLNRMNKN